MSDSTPGAEHTPEPTPEPTPASPSFPSSPTGSTSANDAVATLKSADRLDLGIIGAGVLVFLGSLLPYYTWTVDMPGADTSSLSGWHGFLGWFGALAALVGAALLAARLIGVGLQLPVPVRTAVLGLFALATVCTLLAMFVTPGPDCDGILGSFCDILDEGRGFGYWLALLSTIAGTALAAMRRSAD
ncbi:hypothetical protein J2X46_002062 [Nocardioides sp. BE266]|uniref:hypothetical protein n=1 Tax=Nocardioides sp. BE266 TaxID=2817725 RepID=UPI00285EAD54|nr:hypothetical protein [Nocardioides sp. BE266]MDR7253077.1 hypothetical protein [Nocardioides sp. BE266]